MFVLFDKWTFILRKMVKRKAFLRKPRHQYSVSQWGQQVHESQLPKKQRLLWVPLIISFSGWTLTLRKMVEKSFSCKIEVPILCISIRRTCLWWPILILVEIIISIHDYIFQRKNIGSKVNGRKKSFSCESKAPMSCTTMGKTHLWWWITKLVESITSIHVCLIQWTNLGSKEKW